MTMEREAAMRAMRERSPILEHAPDEMLQCVADATLDAFIKHGERVLEAPRSTAAVHEAGHCVVYAAAGVTVVSTKVFSSWHNERKVWCGLTTPAPGAHREVSPVSLANSDYWEIGFQVAGVLAEELFDKDFHQGSSLDEIVAAQCMSTITGQKLGKDPKKLYESICAGVVNILQRNEAVVRGIAARLMRVRKLEGPKLSQLLDGIKR